MTPPAAEGGLSKNQAWELMSGGEPCLNGLRDIWGTTRCEHPFCEAWMDSWHVYFDEKPTRGLERLLLAARYWGMEFGLYGGEGILDYAMNWLWNPRPYNKWIYQGKGRAAAPKEGRESR